MCTLGLNHLKEELEELASLYQSDRHQDRFRALFNLLLLHKQRAKLEFGFTKT